MLVDLKFLKQITLNSDNTVVSGGGNRLGDLAQRIFDLGGRALPHGTCPYVGESTLQALDTEKVAESGKGTGGHTGYGGFGLFSRKAGLLVDTVVSAQVVLANGTIVTASNTGNTDIFWVRLFHFTLASSIVLIIRTTTGDSRSSTLVRDCDCVDIQDSSSTIKHRVYYLLVKGLDSSAVCHCLFGLPELLSDRS